MEIIGIIPARYASSRFPGKPLADIGGTSMIMRVVGQALLCPLFSRVIVATDDERIRAHVEANGAEAIMTSAEHPSGTDRCLEAMRLSGSRPDAVVNIQGDEPFVHPVQLEQLCRLISAPDAGIATLARRIDRPGIVADPNKVKVVCAEDGRALYFSRSPVPYLKDRPVEEWHLHHDYLRHLGLYAYRASVLETICTLPPSSLEKAESLEQLRWLEAGLSIRVGLTGHESPAVDTPADLEAARDYLRSSTL